jgi:hypothetical protein
MIEAVRAKHVRIALPTVTRVTIAAALFSVTLAVVCPAAAQTTSASDTSRIFLTDGRTLPSVGDYVVVGDRVVFVLPVGAPGASSQQQLMSLPLASVDIPRTSQYSEAGHARQYADSRGPSEYSQMTAEVSETLAAIEKESDPRKRLAMAQEARDRLLDWPKSHYGYRASEVGQLAGLFGDVIAEMKQTAGQARFAVDLMAGPAIPSLPPPMPPLSLRESIELALTAASVSDTPSDRPAILRAALAAMAGVPGVEDLSAEANRRLQLEVGADSAYAAMTKQMTALANAAMRRGDVKSIEALQTELVIRDRALGSLRPLEVKTLSDALQATLVKTRAYRQQLDHWNVLGPRLYQYERDVRPVLSGLSGLQPVFEHIRDSQYMAVDRVLNSLGRLTTLMALFDTVQAPQDVQDIHSTLRSVLVMARQACERRKQIDTAPNRLVAQDAAAAAAGTLLLVTKVRQDLLALLAPPKLQ